MRQYEPIWNALKKDGQATITAPASLHRRIIQAVRKEKWRDDAYRFLLAEEGKQAMLVDVSNPEAHTVTFLLDIKQVHYGLGDL